MFVRKKKNKSGSISVQVIVKVNGRYGVAHTVGAAKDPDLLARLVREGEIWIHTHGGQQQKLFSVKTTDDLAIETFLSTLENAQIRTIGPERIFGTLFDRMGFGEALPNDLFRHLVIARLAYPGSKLKTVDYLKRYRGITVGVDTIYRFLDTLQEKYKDTVERVAFAHTKARLGTPTVAFYDMTTLYFEAEDEDDLRKIGFSKDGKFQCPQIMIGLLLAADGAPIGYDLFEGNTWEGHTLIPILEKFSTRYGLGKPVVVADAGLLSNDNCAALIKAGYTFILGGRIKNEPEKVTKLILSDHELLKNSVPRTYTRTDDTILVVSWSEKRAKKDAHNRERGLRRLESAIARGKLTKASLNKRGYNKFLALDGEVTVTLDKEKVVADERWDGLKGYVTNATLPPETVIERYGDLWRIERAFRISKTDLQIRPIFHRLRKRIEAHLTIAFVAYAIANECERLAREQQAPMSARRAAELTHTMYALEYILPNALERERVILKMDEEQQLLHNVIHK